MPKAREDVDLTQTARGADPDQLSIGRIFRFAVTNLPVEALTLAVSVHLPRYFASHLGVSLAVIATVFGTVRLFDIWLDPALGMAMDRTRTRFGRYRVWMIAGVPILMGALYMLFHAPEGAGRLYLIVWLLIMYLGLSILLLSHAAWAANLATSYHQRSRIFGVMASVGVIGAVAVLIIPIIMSQLHHSDAEGVQAMGWFLIVAAPTAVAIVVSGTPERLGKITAGPHFSLRDYATLFTRGNVLRILAADFCVILGPAWMSALYLIFFKDFLKFTIPQGNFLLMIYILSGFVGAPATAWLANKVSKHRALMVTTTCYSLILTSLLIMPKGSILVALPIMAVLGALSSGFRVMVRAITADVGDEIRLEGGREQIGLLYALTSATTKAAGALSITLTFGLLAAVGYNAREHAVNTVAQIHRLELIYLIGPVIFGMLGGACFFGYKLDALRHGEIRRQLEDRDALYNEAPILESVSGCAATIIPPDSKLISEA